MSSPRPFRIAALAALPALLLLAPAPAAAIATFQVVVENGGAANVSPGGSTVVGTGEGNGYWGAAYRWRDGAVTTTIPSSAYGSGASAASYDGSVFVGFTNQSAFRWENGPQ